ncbi:MAG TPA: nuclear transport factor 2 family protein [Gemmatimonadaceae bacterium]|nr:nuclear transport factor 2 family protein [Gemmatimonadaceae bacterium]
MSNPEHEQIIRHGYAVAEAMDVPGFVNAFTPDGTFTDEAFGNVFTGSKELAIMLQVFGNAFPDMHRELHRFYSVDDVVIVELALQGTHPAATCFESWAGKSKRSTAIGQRLRFSRSSACL